MGNTKHPPEKITMNHRENYIEGGGVHCPFCQSTDITASPFEGDTKSQQVNCDNCGETWYDLYKLIDIQEAGE